VEIAAVTILLLLLLLLLLLRAVDVGPWRLTIAVMMEVFERCRLAHALRRGLPRSRLARGLRSLRPVLRLSVVYMSQVMDRSRRGGRRRGRDRGRRMRRPGGRGAGQVHDRTPGCMLRHGMRVRLSEPRKPRSGVLRPGASVRRKRPGEDADGHDLRDYHEHGDPDHLQHSGRAQQRTQTRTRCEPRGHLNRPCAGTRR
jgi:hypothetical protein